jgi:hypothetical protein
MNINTTLIDVFLLLKVVADLGFYLKVCHQKVFAYNSVKTIW